ncbi:hypothetical protein RFI_35338 [Reticulomyxa filosa]|uniref:Transmembrane protein n=1 Tax=Reticulomyxa filosa TaxID=46433 RepID=X6LJH2_RETFI|nr:hypothetical protein RFI_35338 [Reticulomyxa filosa]|eukprot:ETO02098.1 hypothetical protein RFI_35338 [Reticulomyxa filosa]
MPPDCTTLKKKILSTNYFFSLFYVNRVERSYKTLKKNSRFGSFLKKIIKLQYENDMWTVVLTATGAITKLFVSKDQACTYIELIELNDNFVCQYTITITNVINKSKLFSLQQKVLFIIFIVFCKLFSYLIYFCLLKINFERSSKDKILISATVNHYKIYKKKIKNKKFLKIRLRCLFFMEKIDTLNKVEVFLQFAVLVR